MNFLPGEILSEIVNQETLTNQDLTRLACVSHRLSEAVAARLYRSGELSYVGATDADRRKVEAFGKNGRHVRILSLNLHSNKAHNASVPTTIFPLLATFVNLHSVTLIDTASLSWSDFLHILAIIITSHQYLKILEIQRTITNLDAAHPSDTTDAITLLATHFYTGGKACKLDKFVLRLAKKEPPYLLPRTVLNNLIAILTHGTKSARSFTYTSDSSESPEAVMRDAEGMEIEVLQWNWDNLEELTLKLPAKWIGPHPGGFKPVVTNWKGYTFQKDLQNLKKLVVKARIEDLVASCSSRLKGDLGSMPKLQVLRISHAGGILDWDPRGKPSHPFLELAERIPTLEKIEQTDSYYLTHVIQSWDVVRTEDGEIKFKEGEQSPELDIVTFRDTHAY
ncbi:hypothetical protein TWF694_000358 [Orbilia ellipsospora]|uniref:F-box domain-containing protein n=1 Tax=Orbilia ellipsospora TaxID=2528407 RepID=A0AAV9XNU0_9PEZI